MLELGYCLRGEIRSATSSLTSVPKPLKLLVGSYSDLKSLFEELKLKVGHTLPLLIHREREGGREGTVMCGVDPPPTPPLQDPAFPAMAQGTTLANILSILAMARKDGDTERDCMFYCISSRGALLGMGPEERATQDPVTSFGDPYIRCVEGVAWCVEGVAWWAESALSLHLPLPCPQTPLYAVCGGVPGAGPHGDVLTQGACTAVGAQGRARVLSLAAQRRARGGH